MKKILILSWSDLYGGAAQAANEIYKCLKKNRNIDFFVQNKISKSKLVKSYKKKTINYYIRSILSFFFYKIRLTKNDYSYNLINSDIVKLSKLNNYDIINLHWINSETLSIFDISNIKKKIILTLHDMWFLNGSEHYLYKLPEKYYKGGKKIDVNKFDYFIWKLKKKIFEKKNFHIVAPSNWIASLAKKSKIFSSCPISIIPYSVDKNLFFKKKIESLRINNTFINKKKNTVDLLFISAGKLSNFRKGFDLLNECLSKFDTENKIRLLIVGHCDIKNINKYSKYTFLGKIDDKIKLNKIYNFSDILALPSRLDNLPNVALEAQSCGLPIVSFKVGGLGDIIDHKKNGFLVNPFNLKTFYTGILYCHKNLVKLTLNSLLKSKKWSPNKIQNAYLRLFNDL